METTKESTEAPKVEASEAPKVEASEAPKVEASEATLKTGGEFLDAIASEPPQPVPGLGERLRAEAAEASPESVKGKNPGLAGNETADTAKMIRVNPEDWKHLKDYKGRAFDPNIHAVNLDGSPKIGTKNRLQVLKKGETNPVKVILSRLSLHDASEDFEVETEEQAHAQAQAVIDHGRLNRKSRRVVNFWFWGGTLIWGLGFRKGKKERSVALVEATTDYMLETGKEIDVPPIVNTLGAFVSDFEEMLWLNVGENPADGAVKKFLLRRLPFLRWAFRKNRKRAEIVKGKPAAEPEKGGE